MAMTAAVVDLAPEDIQKGNMAARQRGKEKAKELDRIKDEIATANARGQSSVELMNYNVTEELPVEVSHLTKVRKMQCTHNFRLSRLPDSLGDLYERLEVLNLGYNNLQEFPLCLCRLKYLQRLDINNNRITSLPTRVDQLKSLETLYLDSNFLLALPYTICHLKSLKQLFLENNPLITEDTQDPADPPVDPTITTCAVTGDDLGDLSYSFVNFMDFAGNKRMPIHYVCGTEGARDLVVEEKDHEVVDYWTLKYTADA